MIPPYLARDSAGCHYCVHGPKSVPLAVVASSVSSRCHRAAISLAFAKKQLQQDLSAQRRKRLGQRFEKLTRQQKSEVMQYRQRLTEVTLNLSWRAFPSRRSTTRRSFLNQHHVMILRPSPGQRHPHLHSPNLSLQSIHFLADSCPHPKNCRTV